MWKRNTREHAGMRSITPLLLVPASLCIHGMGWTAECDEGRLRVERGDRRDGDGPQGSVVTFATFPRCRWFLSVERTFGRLRGEGSIGGEVTA